MSPSAAANRSSFSTSAQCSFDQRVSPYRRAIVSGEWTSPMCVTQSAGSGQTQSQTVRPTGTFTPPTSIAPAYRPGAWPAGMRTVSHTGSTSAWAGGETCRTS